MAPHAETTALKGQEIVTITLTKHHTLTRVPIEDLSQGLDPDPRSKTDGQDTQRHIRDTKSPTETLDPVLETLLTRAPRQALRALNTVDAFQRLKKPPNFDEGHPRLEIRRRQLVNQVREPGCCQDSSATTSTQNILHSEEQKPRDPIGKS